VATTVGHTYTDGVCVCGKVQTFTITWVNGDSTRTTTVEYGNVPAAPFESSELAKTPDVEYHYSFAGWADADSRAVTEAFADVTYTAVYSEQDHDYRANCKVCSVCKYDGDGSRAHKVGNPTCTEDAVCEVCHIVVTPAYGHLFTYDTSKCHWSVDANGNHVYHFVASCSRENICHETEEIAVIAVELAEGYKAPTCTADGSNHYVINLLKYTFNDKEYTLTVEFDIVVVSPGHQHDANAKVYTWVDTITETKVVDGVEVEVEVTYTFYGKLCNSTCNQLIEFKRVEKK
jgi:hypothetical protein